MTNEKKLRSGWTTGACATAATKAAFEALITGRFPDPVTISLPKGRTPSFAVERAELDGAAAQASIIKDAGDDPDVTHGAEIISSVRRLSKGEGVVFKAGEGVGMVTRPGLPLPVGEPAINPGPRKMICRAIAEVAEAHDTDGDLEVTISIANGAELAEKTMNGRLGIVGGLSVLGTTGVVTPYSCAAWISAIHRGVDVARASGQTHIAACTGSTSEKALQERLDLPEFALIDMGDFVGGLLKYLKRHPVERLTIGGGFAKLVKLAQGERNLHSKESTVDFDRLAQCFGEAGAPMQMVSEAKNANTALEVLEKAVAAKIPLGDMIAKLAAKHVRSILPKSTEVEVQVFDRQGGRVGYADI